MNQERDWVLIEITEDTIDLYAAAPELLKALELLEEEVDNLRTGKTWSRDYIGVVQAHLRAKMAIRKAKGESVTEEKSA